MASAVEPPNQVVFLHLQQAAASFALLCLHLIKHGL
jgi:hypothetical protein